MAQLKSHLMAVVVMLIGLFFVHLKLKIPCFSCKQLYPEPLEETSIPHVLLTTTTSMAETLLLASSIVIGALYRSIFLALKLILEFGVTDSEADLVIMFEAVSILIFLILFVFFDSLLSSGNLSDVRLLTLKSLEFLFTLCVAEAVMMKLSSDDPSTLANIFASRFRL